MAMFFLGNSYHWTIGLVARLWLAMAIRLSGTLRGCAGLRIGSWRLSSSRAAIFGLGALWGPARSARSRGHGLVTDGCVDGVQFFAQLDTVLERVCKAGKHQLQVTDEKQWCFSNRVVTLRFFPAIDWESPVCPAFQANINHDHHIDLHILVSIPTERQYIYIYYTDQICVQCRLCHM